MNDLNVSPQSGQGTPIDNAPISVGQAQQNAMAETQSSDEPFFKYKFDDGKEEVYKSKDELERAFKSSYLRHSDYTRKTQEAANLKKDIENQRKEIDDLMKQVNGKKAQYDKWDETMKTRPDIMRQLNEMAARPATPDSIYERATNSFKEELEPVKKELEEWRNWKKQQEIEKTRNGVYSKLKAQYSDFDESEIEQGLEALATEDYEPLVEMLYWASKGRKSPTQIREDVMGDLKKKSSAGMLPVKGSGNSKKSGIVPRTPKEAAELAMRELVDNGG